MRPFSDLNGPFPECLNALMDRSTPWKSLGKQPVKKRGIKRFLILPDGSHESVLQVPKKRGQFHAAIRVTISHCDSCAQGALKRETDEITAKLLRCGIIGEALLRNMPLRRANRVLAIVLLAIVLYKSWFSGRGWAQQLFTFQSPAVHWIARTSSLNRLSCRNPYQTPHSLNCLPPFHWKPHFFTEKCLVASPSQKSAQTSVIVL